MSEVIGPGAYVELHYTLRDGRGNLLEETGPESYAFVYGMGAVVPGLEHALEGARAGEVLNVTVAPEDAYGLRDPTDVFEVDRSEFPHPDAVEVGSEFTAEGDDGTELSMRVVEIHDDHIVVDANHPLAGETLNFHVVVSSVRAATNDEILAAQTEITEPDPTEEKPS